jgi:hypothetical protein
LADAPLTETIMNKPTFVFAVLGAASLLAAAGCSSDDSSTKADDTAADAQAEGWVPWEKKSHEEKEQHMKEAVKPTMGKLLTEFDGEEFAKVTCKTCHGESGPSRDWKMPTDELPKLDPTDHFAAHQGGHDGEMLKFMMETFSDKMAEVLDVAPWTPDNPEGFGCFNCHTMAEPGSIDADHDSDSDSDSDHHAGGEHEAAEASEAAGAEGASAE